MISHEIESDKNIAFIIVEGAPAFDEYCAAAKKMVADAAYQASVHRIVDFREADLDGLSTLDFLKFSKFATKEIPIHDSAKTALVTKDKSIRSILPQLFLRHFMHLNVQLFTDYDEAMAWVG